MPGEFVIDKSTNILGLYERDSEQEKIKIPGPIPFEITVQVSCKQTPGLLKILMCFFSILHWLGFGSRQK